MNPTDETIDYAAIAASLAQVRDRLLIDVKNRCLDRVGVEEACERLVKIDAACQVADRLAAPARKAAAQAAVGTSVMP